MIKNAVNKNADSKNVKKSNPESLDIGTSSGAGSGFDRGFVDLYRRFQKPVVKFLAAKIGNPEVASDLAQEVFLKLSRFWEESFEDTTLLAGYVFSVARNTAVDWFRGTSLERGKVRALEEDEDFVAPESLLSVEASERRSRFKECLRLLTRPQRRVVWLRMIHGLSFEEISERLELSVSAAKCLLHRAKETWVGAGLIVAPA